MVSNLALADIGRTEREYGQMSISDIINLNALALRVTDDPSCSLCMMPRVAICGDVMLRQPNLRQEMALQSMQGVYSRDGQTSLVMVAYILAQPDIDTDRLLAHPYMTAWRISRWIRQHMADETYDHIAACCRHCLDGSDQSSGETAYISDEQARRLETNVKPGMCGTMMQYAQAMITGLQGRDALRLTSPMLDQLISQSWALRRGEPPPKQDRQAVADYYATLEAVRAKMAKAKTDTQTQDTTNG